MLERSQTLGQPIRIPPESGGSLAVRRPNTNASHLPRKAQRPGRLKEITAVAPKAPVADYILVYRNHKLAVVEAKAWDEQSSEGLAQAKNYAGKLAVRYAYSTNGQTIYGVDLTAGGEGEVPHDPTPEELWNGTFAEADAWRDRFAAVPFEDKGGYFNARYYQDVAINRVTQAIAAGRDRLLLTLAPAPAKILSLFRSPGSCFTAAGT